MHRYQPRLRLREIFTLPTAMLGALMTRGLCLSRSTRDKLRSMGIVSRTGLCVVLGASVAGGCAGLIDLEPGILVGDAGDAGAGGSGGAGGGHDAPTAAMSGSSSSATGGPGGSGGVGGGCGAGSGGGDPLCGGSEWAHWAPSGEKCFTVIAETALDATTGLQWQRVSPQETFTHADAIAHCSALELAAHDDWRLPTRIELASIINYATKNPAAYLDGFPDATSETLWSSSQYAPDPTSAWAVNFTDGSMSAQAKDVVSRIRCVR